MSADVRGSELWFETADVELTASTEMFATALLPIAAGAGATIELEGALDPVWRRNAARILRVWNGWWGYEPAIDAIVKAPEAQLGRGPATLDTGLCFTLGVDSFYTLLRAPDELDALILAHGYDIPRADRARIDDARDSLVAVAEATGCRAVIVETNLREHPVGVQMDWERGHGGAIAAVGHACEGLIGRLLISSSYPYSNDQPWGSHFRTDQGWSSSRLQVEHYGADLRRAEKLGEIADEPLVQQHLRVCWEHRSSSANCGECEKCLRTMVSLVNHRALERFPGLPHDRLVERVDAIAAAPPAVLIVWETQHRMLRDRRLRRAVGRLIERSGPQAATGSRLRFVRRGFGAGSDGSTISRRNRPV
ncbi:MAG TPA: hypothetical protein VD765_02475 [Solirubrobacterales bacterium]|nr:hypothetical protein [Solirubrobacterales bacterium]